MKILSQLEGLSYDKLPPDLKKTFNNYNVQIIKISKESHPDVKFEIFERLNTGSVSLSDQEIRNCIYRGNYNELLNELAGNKNFQGMLGLSSSAVRMQDVELVLRFMAFNESTHLNYNKKMRGFLNDHMRDRRNISEEMKQKYRSDFLGAVDVSYSVFGDKAFRRFSYGDSKNRNGKWENAINKAIFDIIMFWFARYPKNKIIGKKDQIRERFIEMCTHDREFIDAVTLGTADPGRVRTRFRKWEEALGDIVGNSDPERRAFSYDEKQTMFDANQTCHICGQRIEHLDDAEVDHVVPFSQGGVTDVSNGKLAHRFCNRAKGAAV